VPTSIAATETKATKGRRDLLAGKESSRDGGTIRKVLKTKMQTHLAESMLLQFSENEDDKPRVSQEDKTRILKEMHENPTGGHLGMNRTYERIKLLYLGKV
jgi:hypothetical protein